MQDDREADIADVRGHALADPHPAALGAVHAVDAAVVLLEEHFGCEGMQQTQCGSWPNSGYGIGIDRHATAVERRPRRALVGGFEDAAARHADVHVGRVARVDQDRVQLGPVRRAVLLAAGPLEQPRMLVEAGDRLPRVAAVLGAKEALRRGAGVPRVRLARVRRREPEDVIHHTSLLPRRGLGEGW